MPSRTSTFTGGEGAVERLATALVESGFDVGAPRRTDRLLLDTFDGRLDDAGLRLEHRTTPDGPVLVLSDTHSTPARLAAARPPRSAADLPAGPFRDRLSAATDGRALLPQRAVSGPGRSVVRRNRQDKTVAAATIYDGLRVGDDTWPTVVEVSDLVGYDGAGTRLVDVLRANGLAEADGDAFDLGGPLVAPGRATASPTIPLDGREPAADAVRAVLVHLLDAVEINRPGTIDDLDAEFLHELRVAVRRSRSVLAHARRVLPIDDVTRGRAELAWLGAVTGPPRDLDVYQLEWNEYVRLLSPDARRQLEPIRLHLDDQRVGAHDRLAADLRSDRTVDFVTWWRRTLTMPAGVPAPDGQAPVAEVVGEQVRRAHRRLVEGGRAIEPTSPADAVHELRKDAKRLRYLLECFGALWATPARKAFVGRLKALQDNLGTHQDADVHGHHLRALAAELAGRLPVDTVLAAGQLVEQLDQRRAATRADFVVRWADFDSKPTRQALRDLLGSKRLRPR